MDRKSPVTREQAEAEELAAIGQEILINARNELYLNMRYMDVALSALFPVPDYAVRGLQTDGISLFFHPRDLAALYRRGRAEVNRAYLHMVFHCLFGHLSGARDPRWGNELIWDVACDVAAEALEQSEDTFNLMLYLHNWLCENVTYEAMPEDYDDIPRVCGAVGALVDGRANCQGYADAFRLLGLLCGLEVRKQEGFDSDGGEHDWNVVCIEGDWFIVDVTWDDVDDSDTWNYAYLNAGTDVNNYTWNAGAAAADICSITYPRMWFYTRTGREYSDVADMARAAYFARRDDGVEVFRGVVYQQGLDWEDLSQAILALAQERGKKCSWHISCSNRGPYSYYSVRWTKW